MGKEARCEAVWKRRRLNGVAQLETAEVRFRGELRLTMRLATLSEVAVTDGVLKLTGPEGTLSLVLGANARGWADAIRQPKARIDKLGIKTGQRVAVLGVDDASLGAELRERGAAVASRMASGVEVVFLGAASNADLARLARIEDVMARAGAVWVVWPKGRPTLREDDVRAAARRAGLVDVKVVAFSPTHSALKLVIPLARR